MSAQVELFHDLDAVEADADGALGRDRRACAFERLEWFRLVERFTPAGKLLVLRARRETHSAWLFLFSNSGMASPLANWYSLRFGTIGDAAAADGLVAGLRRGGMAALALSPLVEDDPLVPALRRHGWLARLSRCSVNWQVRTAGLGFDDYWARRPSRLRNTARRRAKTAGLELRLHDSFDDGAWSDYEAVYEHSWKPAEGSPALMRAFAASEGAAGALRLGLAYRDGKPVAAQLWTVENGRATIHKLAYREDAKHYSPGTVLSAEMFRRVIDVDRAELIDFGLGDDAYKAEWMDEAVPLYRLEAYDLRSVSGMVALARAAGSKLVRRLVSR
jgi:CelD/BcsL family acetyltransferase involved in cellulose biosynthesis